MRTAYDFSPLYRSMIGIDRLASLVQAATLGDGDALYPPCDIEKTGEDAYRITLAAAGFKPEELDVNAQPNLLVVAGRKQAADGRAYLHRGIPSQAFQRRFELADHVVVKSAAYADGLLTIDLVRQIPEVLKPRRIAIGQAPRTRMQRITDRLAGRRAA